MNATNAIPYRELVSRLRTLGLTKSQVSALLPDWWDAEAASTDAGAWEFAVMISRRLSLDASALARGEIRSLAGLAAPRFKHTARVTSDQLQAATRIASALAKAVLASIHTRVAVPRLEAHQVRQAILRKPNTQLGFDALLQFAWEIGIPVIPLPNLPNGVKKMDAAAINVEGRPAIVIARKNDSKSWLSFVLAHELGHVLLGHVPDSGAIIEGSLKDTAAFEAESQLDAQEREANTFAHAVLGGPEADREVSTWSRGARMLELVDAATQAAPALRASPGHLILRYAFMTGRWAEASLALRFIADDVDAQRSLVEKMAESIDTQAIGEDLQDFVEQVTGIAARAA